MRATHVAGAPDPLLLALLTIAFAMLPLGAEIAVDLRLAADARAGQQLPDRARRCSCFGMAVTIIGDNFLWPALVGRDGAAAVPAGADRRAGRRADLRADRPVHRPGDHGRADHGVARMARTGRQRSSRAVRSPSGRAGRDLLAAHSQASTESRRCARRPPASPSAPRTTRATDGSAARPARRSPSFGCATLAAMPRWRTCGSANVWSTE